VNYFDIFFLSVWWSGFEPKPYIYYALSLPPELGSRGQIILISNLQQCDFASVRADRKS